MATAGRSEGSEPGNEQGNEPGNEQGCEHYRRGCRLRVGERGAAVPWQEWSPIRAPMHAVSLPSQAPCCGKLYPCRLCHDGAEEHQLDRFRVSEVQCIRCRLLQKVGPGSRRAQAGRDRAGSSFPPPCSSQISGVMAGCCVRAGWGWIVGKGSSPWKALEQWSRPQFWQRARGIGTPGGMLGAVLCGAQRWT